MQGVFFLTKWLICLVLILILMKVLETRARLTQQEFEARVRNEAVLQQLAVACRQVA